MPSFKDKMVRWVRICSSYLWLGIAACGEWIVNYWEWFIFLLYIMCLIGIAIAALSILSVRSWILENLPWSIGFSIGTLLVLLALATNRTSAKKKNKEEIEQEIEKAFEKVLKRRPGISQPVEFDEADVYLFYSGGVPRCSIWYCFEANLDFPRSKLRVLRQQASQWSARKPHCCEIPVGRQQGKTYLMRRFALDLAEQRDCKVLWWLGRHATEDKYKFPTLELLGCIRQYKSKVVGHRTKLIVFMDDLLEKETTVLEDVTERIGSAYIFLWHAEREHFVCVYPSSKAGSLKFDGEDRDSLLEKLVEKSLMDRSTASRFAADHGMQRLCGAQLVVFLSLVFEKLGKEPHRYLKQFEKLLKELPGLDKEFLKEVATCHTLFLAYPEVVLQGKVPELANNAESGPLADLLVKEPMQTGQEIWGLTTEQQALWNGYLLRAPYFARWLLRNEYKIMDGGQLQDLYSQLLSDVLSFTRRAGDEAFVMEYVRVVLYRLARNWHRLVYPEFRGRIIARNLFSSLEDRLIPYLESLDDFKQLLRWAVTMRKLQKYELADRLYLKAETIAQKEAKLDTSSLAYLAIGLKDLQDVRKRVRALVYFNAVMQRIVGEQLGANLLNQIADAYVDLVNSLDGARKALEKWDELASLLKPSGFEPDVVFVVRRAQLLDNMDRLPQAQSEFQRAIRLARDTFEEMPETLIYALHYYVAFLSEKGGRLEPALREDPWIFLQEAKAKAKGKEVGYEVVLYARAKQRDREGNIKGAKAEFEALVAFCEQQGIVHPHGYVEFARFLCDHGKELAEKPYATWLAEAEDYCWKVIEAEEADRHSQLAAYHFAGIIISGGTCYTSKNGRNRPDFAEGINVLEQSFETSSKEERDSRGYDREKTFQDCITHNAIGQAYLRWADYLLNAAYTNKMLNRENVADPRQLYQKADPHFRKAFSGLPRHNLWSDKVIRHVLESYTQYGLFVRKRLKEPPQKAKPFYEKGIELMVSLGYDDRRIWPRSWSIYQKFGNFLWDNFREQLDDIKSNYLKALLRMPSDTSMKEKSVTRHAFCSCLCKITERELENGYVELGAHKFDITHGIWNRALKEAPSNDPLMLFAHNLIAVLKRFEQVRSDERLLRIWNTVYQIWHLTIDKIDTDKRMQNNHQDRLVEKSLKCLGYLFDVGDLIANEEALIRIAQDIIDKTKRSREAASQLEIVRSRKRKYSLGPLTRRLFE